MLSRGAYPHDARKVALAHSAPRGFAHDEIALRVQSRELAGDSVECHRVGGSEQRPQLPRPSTGSRTISLHREDAVAQVQHTALALEVAEYRAVQIADA